MSEAGLPPLWSPAQQSWLQAMGYTVFVDGNVEAAPEPADHFIPGVNNPAASGGECARFRGSGAMISAC